MLGRMTVLGRDTTERLVDCAAVQGFVGASASRPAHPDWSAPSWSGWSRPPTTPPTPCRSPLLRTLLDAAGPPPRGSSVTYEPGGQLELSSPAVPRRHRLLAGADRGRRARPPGPRPRRAGPPPHRDRPVPAAPAPAGAPPLRRDGGLLRGRRAGQRRDRPGDDDRHRRAAGQPRHRPRRGRRPAGGGGCCTTVAPDDGRGVRELPRARRAGHRLEVRAGSRSGSGSTCERTTMPTGHRPRDRLGRATPSTPS